MAPSGIVYNSDAEPTLDESSSLSSANVKINEEKAFIQLYETKADFSPKKAEMITGKKLAIISIAVVMILVALIFYTVFLHLVTWEAKIERRIEELSLREKSAGVIKIERVNKSKMKASSMDGAGQKQRNHQAQSQSSIAKKQYYESNDLEGDSPSKGQLQGSNIYQRPSHQVKTLLQSPNIIKVDNSNPLLKLQQSQQKSSTLFVASNSINNDGKGVVSISSLQTNVSSPSNVQNNQMNSFVSSTTHNGPNTPNGKIIYSNNNGENSVNSEFQNNYLPTYQTTAPTFQLNQQPFSSNNPAPISSVQNFNPIFIPVIPQNSQNSSPSIAPSNPQNSRVVVLAPIAPQVNIQNRAIEPTILPFNPQVRASVTMDYYGYDAGISIDLVTKGRQRRKLLDLEINQTNDISKEEVEYYENKYNVGKYDQLPFCVVVPTYNNAPNGRYMRNINSIIMQNYSNYHIVIIDDASTDLTGQLIKNHLSSLKYEPSKYTITINTVKLNAMPNLRSAAMNSCGQQEIFLVVDGDDELLGKQVFKLFNAVFQQKGLWFVYSNFLMGAGDVGFSRPFTHQTIRSNSYRSTAFVTSHLRAFYTKLFRNIADADLRDSSGQYFRAANDVAICIPSLQQSHLRIGYLPELAYFYNANTGNNNHFLRLQEQKSNDISLRSRPSYKPLEKLF